jgi:hypothetical protein
VSRAVSLFELASSAARKHDQARPDCITVVPIVVDDLEAVLPVLRALCAVTEGQFFNAGDPELQGPVPGTTDPLRRAAIGRALTGRPTSTRHVDLVDQGQGMLDAAFADPAGGVASQGEQEVLAWRGKRRTVSTTSFAVIAYREHLSTSFRQAVWRYGRSA